MPRGDVWRMVRRRAVDAEIETAIGCHTFRATGITDYLTNGGRIEVAQTHGRTLKRENNRALRSAQRQCQRGRSRTDRNLITARLDVRNPFRPNKLCLACFGSCEASSVGTAFSLYPSV
jgi:hypothetical protein